MGTNQRLDDGDLEILSIELLITLQRSLVAKLILVNVELRNRYRTLVAISDGLTETNGARETLSAGVRKLSVFNDVLRNTIGAIYNETWENDS